MADLTFSVVQRPGKERAAVIPGKLVDAIERTVTSGQAVRIEIAGWSLNRGRTLYRALHTWGKGTPFTVVRRRTETEIYVWGVRK